MTTYRKAGVNIAAGNLLVRNLRKMIPSIGGFSGFFPLKEFRRYGEPVLVCSTDGVGTKLKIAQLCNRHDTVGIDLVAMSVNDIITCGAKPLVFLDYFACGKLHVGTAQKVIKGINDGCRESGCELIGGETAEMPGFYGRGEYDLAGFCAGIVDKKDIIDGSATKKGDVIFGIPSSGVHSNGYSLLRKVLSRSEQKKYGGILLKPTRIYTKDILGLISKVRVKGICHITGGGFYDNITRIMPEKLGIRVMKDAWKVPDIFNVIREKGKIGEREMYRTFNMGIGMVVIAEKKDAEKVLAAVKDIRVIGEVTGTKRGVEIV